MKAVAAMTCALLVAGSAFGAAPCRQAVGLQRAQTLVQQCQQMSSASNQACDTSNTCEGIMAETKRGCLGMAAAQRPKFCSSYH
jgi:hypothetical protein